MPTAREVFEQGLDSAPNQLERQPRGATSLHSELLDLAATPGHITEAGLRTDVSVGFQYISFWLSGRGAAAINSLMEDAATAEISRIADLAVGPPRLQLEDGRTVTRRPRPRGARRGDREDPRGCRRRDLEAGRPAETRRDLRGVALSPELIEFLTIPAYEYLD